jgi:uncharacterized membrane protein
MKSKAFISLLILLIGIGFIGLVCASNDYSIEFNQTAEKLIVSENISGNYSTYTDRENLEKTSSGYIFLHKLDFEKSFDEVMIKLNLDEGFIIYNQEAYPASYILETDGKKITLVWRMQNVSKSSSFALFVIIKDTRSSLTSKLVLVTLDIVILSIIAWFVYRLYSKTKKEKKFDKHLLESERKIIKELKSSDKEGLWQKEIQIKTGFSKAKLSRVIRNLESRGLIRKVPLGNTNKVTLR